MKANTKIPKQTNRLKREKSAYGGSLRNTRAGRSKPRPISTRETMHLVLRSSQAKGAWSFKNARHSANIARIVSKFASAYGVRVLSMANVGNHLLLQIKIGNRFTYSPFIRAITGAIAQSVTGRSRWKKQAAQSGQESQVRFWDHRPFTRIVKSLSGYLRLKDYVRLNQLEGSGWSRAEARMMIDVEKRFDDPIKGNTA